jgi:hypothetical protein
MASTPPDVRPLPRGMVFLLAGASDGRTTLTVIRGLFHARLPQTHGLPYLLRYETEKKYSNRPHADHVVVLVNVPRDDMSAEDLLRAIAQALPGWQATASPSHMILYKESRRYTYGDVIWPTA